jgi:hypothetical protein
LIGGGGTTTLRSNANGNFLVAGLGVTVASYSTLGEQQRAFFGLRLHRFRP